MHIGIIGCGWLGLPLAKKLIEVGHQITGSTTSGEKVELLKAEGITPVLLNLDPEPKDKAYDELFKTDLLFINIPPKSRSHPPEHYTNQIKFLNRQIQNSEIRKVIFISSTSFYPNINQVVTTDTLADLNNGSTKAVVQGEEEINKVDRDLLILRCGGLMGDDRIPGKWFAGKKVRGGHTPVNYIHRDDVITIISEFINKGFSGKLVKNLVSDDHPNRKEVYQVMASRYGFEAPEFIEPRAKESKIVKSDFPESGLRSPLDF